MTYEKFDDYINDHKENQIMISNHFHHYSVINFTTPEMKLLLMALVDSNDVTPERRDFLLSQRKLLREINTLSKNLTEGEKEFPNLNVMEGGAVTQYMAAEIKEINTFLKENTPQMYRDKKLKKIFK